MQRAAGPRPVLRCPDKLPRRREFSRRRGRALAPVAPTPGPARSVDARQTSSVQGSLPITRAPHPSSLAGKEVRRPLTRGGSPVRDIRSPGSVRGAPRKGGPYRDVCAGQSRQEEVGDRDEQTPANRGSPTPGGVRPREVQSLRTTGRLVGRSVGGRVREPGDRASKTSHRWCLRPPSRRQTTWTFRQERTWNAPTTRSRGVRRAHNCFLHGNRETSEAPRRQWWAAGNGGKAVPQSAERAPRSRT
jgi:hypothetical protein